MPLARPTIGRRPLVETGRFLAYSGRMSETSIRPVVASGSRRAFLGALVAGAWCVRPPRGPAQAPALGLLVCGDSMVKTVARSLTREFAAFPSIRMSQLISIGTGLARPDVFDWPAKLKEAAADRPAAVVIMLGANDGQNLRTAQGSVVTEGTPEWTTEYAGRVAALLAQARAAGAEHILWVGMPDMREKKLQADAQRINAIAQAECARTAGAEYFDTTAIFSPRPGTYSAYIVQPGGRPLLVRASDGGHLNGDGADLLARAIRDKLATWIPLQ